MSHSFGENTVLNGVDLSAREGEIHALLGPNGAGKTTLLRSLMGLLVPNQGEIRVLGMDPATRPSSCAAGWGSSPAIARCTSGSPASRTCASSRASTA